MQKITQYMRLDSVKAVVVDRDNMPLNTFAPEITRGMAIELVIGFYANAEATDLMTAAQLAQYAAVWDFGLAHDWDTTTTPQIRVSSGIAVDTDGLLHIPITETNTQELITKLGTLESIDLGAELLGFAAGESSRPSLVLQWPMTVRNRRLEAGTGTPTEVEDGQYTAAQVNALFAAAFELQFSADGSSWHTTQAASDIYFRFRNSSVSGDWSDAIQLPQGIAGTNGTDGTNGTNGITPSINPTNKHWMIGDTDTGILAEATMSFDDLTSEQKASLKGDDGITPTFAIGTVTTLPAGSNAIVTITGSAEDGYVINLAIPQGPAGQNGTNGANGTNGTNGTTPTIAIGTVTTLPAGSDATASLTGNALEGYVLNLGIPRGANGSGSSGGGVINSEIVPLVIDELSEPWLSSSNLKLDHMELLTFRFTPSPSMELASGSVYDMTPVVLSSGGLTRPAYAMTLTSGTAPTPGGTVTPSDGDLVWVKLTADEIEYLKYSYFNTGWPFDTWIEYDASGDYFENAPYQPETHVDANEENRHTNASDVRLASLQNNLDPSGTYTGTPWTLSARTSAKLYEGLYSTSATLWNGKSWYLVRFYGVKERQVNPAQTIENLPEGEKYWDFQFVTSNGRSLVEFNEKTRAQSREYSDFNDTNMTATYTESWTGDYFTSEYTEAASTTEYTIEKISTAYFTYDDDDDDDDWLAALAKIFKAIEEVFKNYKQMARFATIGMEKPTGATGLAIVKNRLSCVNSMTSLATLELSADNERSIVFADGNYKLIDKTGFSVEKWDDASALWLSPQFLIDTWNWRSFIYFWTFNDGRRSEFLQAPTMGLNHYIPIGSFDIVADGGEVSNSNGTKLAEKLSVAGSNTSNINGDYTIVPGEYSCGAPVYKNSNHYTILKTNSISRYDGIARWAIMNGGILCYSASKLSDTFSGDSSSYTGSVTVTPTYTYYEPPEDNGSGEDSGSGSGSGSSESGSGGGETAPASYTASGAGDNSFNGTYTLQSGTDTSAVYSNGTVTLQYDSYNGWAFYSTIGEQPEYYNNSSDITASYNANLDRYGGWLNPAPTVSASGDSGSGSSSSGGIVVTGNSTVNGTYTLDSSQTGYGGTPVYYCSATGYYISKLEDDDNDKYWIFAQTVPVTYSQPFSGGDYPEWTSSNANDVPTGTWQNGATVSAN